MAKVITVMNMKGGVGKTTVAMHLGGMLGRRRFGNVRKVLIIDYDPQFNLSQAFIPPTQYFDIEEQRKTCLAILLDDESEVDPFRLQVPGNQSPPKVAELAHRIYPNLDIVPSTLDLMYVALGQSDSRLKPCEERFEKFIAECRTVYDLVIIDCHPAGSILTKTSLQNSDHVIIPVVPQSFAIRGIALMLEFIKSKKMGPTGPVPHILFNRVARTGDPHPDEVLVRENPRFARLCVTKTLKTYKIFGEPVGGVGFAWTSGKPYSTQALQNLSQVTEEIITRTGL